MRAWSGSSRQASAAASSRRVVALACGVLVLAVFAAYANSLSGPFVYDDKDSIVNNLTLRHLWPLSEVLAPLRGGLTVSGRPVLPGVAMTGEITLRGRVLPIGGLKEKTLAAHRDGIKTVLYPAANTADLEDIPADILREVKMIPVTNFGEVLELALAPAQRRSAARPRGREAWPQAAPLSIPPPTGGVA